jgi:hypothetical protein
MIEAVIIGAGPYGLSIAAHFRGIGIPFRIFGRTMDSWSSHMPKGMLLKSDGFASNIYDPEEQFTLRQFCVERGLEYAEMGVPVRLNTFSSYGAAFRDRVVPDLEEKLVTGVDVGKEGFLVVLETGETLTAKRVIVAVGITHFEYVPESLRGLPPEFLSHSFQHSSLDSFRGRRIGVIGAGSSAIDLAGLLHEMGSDVQLVARERALSFHEKASTGGPKSLWQSMRSPRSGLGPGLRSRFFADSPHVFHYLPERYRLQTVRTFLGPSGGWFAKDKVVGKVPLLLGFSPLRAELSDQKVCLTLRAQDGIEQKMYFEHVIAATGYKVDLNRLNFLSKTIQSRIRTAGGAPVLSVDFEATIPGLYFAGLAAANSFGPVMRFAYGARYTAQRLANTIAQFVPYAQTLSAPSRVQSVKKVGSSR